METDETIAAASILRKRFKEISFPLLPASHENGTVDLNTAIKMIKGLSQLPSQEVCQFYGRYTRKTKQYCFIICLCVDKYQQLYGEFVRYHSDCVQGQAYLHWVQKCLLQELKEDGTTLDPDIHYFKNLRQIIEHELTMYVRLG